MPETKPIAETYENHRKHTKRLLTHKKPIKKDAKTLQNIRKTQKNPATHSYTAVVDAIGGNNTIDK